MDVNELIGRVVIHGGFKAYGEGTIVALDGEYIIVNFGGEEKKFLMEIFINQLQFNDDETRELMQKAIEQAKAKKEADEAARRAADEAARIVRETAEKRERIVGGFGADYHAEHLKTDIVYTYQEVERNFNIRIAGFGRGCNPTDDSVVLISSVGPEDDNFVYHDKWDNGDYIFSGEGRIGDQTMSRGNSEIVNAEANGKAIHLFVKQSAQEYYYQGIFKLVDYTYEDDYDANGNIRKEYKFRLREA